MGDVARPEETRAHRTALILRISGMLYCFGIAMLISTCIQMSACFDYCANHQYIHWCLSGALTLLLMYGLRKMNRALEPRT